MVLYAANSEDNTISMIDPISFKKIGDIHLKRSEQRGPRRLCYSLGVLYCINSYSSTLSEISSEGIREHNVGVYPNGIAISQGDVIVCCGESDSIWYRWEGRDEVMAQKAFPMSVEILNGNIIIANLISSDISVFQSGFMSEQRIQVAGFPMYAVMDSRKRILCAHVGYQGSGYLSVFDAKGTLLKCISAGVMPCVIKIINNTAIISDIGNSNVLFVDLDSISIIKCVNVGNMPDDIAIFEQEGVVFVSCMMDGVVVAMDFNGNIMGSILVGSEPRGLALAEQMI